MKVVISALIATVAVAVIEIPIQKVKLEKNFTKSYHHLQDHISFFDYGLTDIQSDNAYVGTVKIGSN